MCSEQREITNIWVLLGPQMKAIVKVKFCNTRLDQDDFSKEVLAQLRRGKCAVFLRLIVSTGGGLNIREAKFTWELGCHCLALQVIGS